MILLNIVSTIGLMLYESILITINLVSGKVKIFSLSASHSADTQFILFVFYCIDHYDIFGVAIFRYHGFVFEPQHVIL